MASSATLAEAFLAAQIEFPEIPKDKENPHFKSRYSSLDAINSATRPILNKHGLITYHETPLEAGVLTVTAVLEYAPTGQKRVNSMAVDANTSIQGIGSLETYLRRYTLAPLLGICSDEDDDGNQAREGQEEAPAKAQLPACPKCGKTEYVIVGKPEYGGGYVCYGKKGGCGEKWQKPSDVDAAKKAEAERIAAEHGMKTADQLPPNGKSDTKPELPRPDKNAVFESWATFILQITPDSFDSDLGSIRATLKEGKIKPPHVEPILRAAAKRAETAGQFDMLDQLILPLKETIRADDEGWTKLAIDIDKAREVRLGDPVPA